LSLLVFSNDSLDLTPFLSQIESLNGNVVGNNGLKIVSSAPINVLYDLQAASNKELFSLKGARALGTDFYATAYANAGTDDSLCANVDITLNSSFGGGAITGSWSSNGFGTFANGLNSVPNTYIPSPLDTLISPIRLILSTTGYCPVAKDTLFLHVTPAPIVNANVDQSICDNNADIQLNGSVSGGATSGVWSVNGNGTFVPNASSLNAVYSPSPSDIGAGILTFVLTSSNNSSLTAQYWPSAADTTQGEVVLYLSSTSNGNCSVVKDSIIVLITNAPVVYAGVNQIVCSNDASIQLAGSVTGGAFATNWTGGTGSLKIIRETQLQSANAEGGFWIRCLLCCECLVDDELLHQ